MESKGYSLLEVLMAITLMVIVGGAAIPLAHTSVDRYESSRGSQLRGRAHGDGSIRGRQALGLRGDSICPAAGRLLAADLRRRQSQWRAHPRHRAWHRSADHRRRTARLSLHAASSSAFSRTSRASIRAHSTRAIRFKSAARRCSASARQDRRRQGTLFIRGLRGNQFAVRVLGATGRTRILEFNFGLRTWLAR